MAKTQIEMIRDWFVDGKTYNNPSLRFFESEVQYSWPAQTIVARTSQHPFLLLNHDVIFRSWNSGICGLENFMNGNIIKVSFEAARTLDIDVGQIKLICKNKLRSQYISEVVFEYENRVFMTCQDTCWYGIIELDFVPKSWDEAYRSLTPNAVRDFKKYAEEKYKNYAELRQGEWWCIPRPNIKFSGCDIEKYKSFGNHVATYHAKSENVNYIRGTLRHHPDAYSRGNWHNRYFRPWIRLGSCWHEIHKGNFVNSASG